MLAEKLLAHPVRVSVFVQKNKFCSSINLALVPVLSSVKFVFDKFRSDEDRDTRRESTGGP